MARASHAGAPHYDPVAVRARHDGWSPARQLAFLDALAESGCIHEACASVGVSRQSAYRLRMRTDAQAFRMAWDAALDFAVRRVSDEMFSRAIHGVAVPHFYKGELVGEHRRYDNRLAMFLVRYRDPLRYAATLDQMVYDGHAEVAALQLAEARERAAEVAYALADEPLAEPEREEPRARPYGMTVVARARIEQAARAKEEAKVEAQRRYDQARAEEEAGQAELDRILGFNRPAPVPIEPDPEPDDGTLLGGESLYGGAYEPPYVDPYPPKTEAEAQRRAAAARVAAARTASGSGEAAPPRDMATPLSPSTPALPHWQAYRAPEPRVRSLE